MKRILMSGIVLLALSGCQDGREKQAQHDAAVAQEAREQLLEELKAKEIADQKIKEEKEKDSKLSQIGVTIDKGILTVDTNKTKGFFQDLGNKLENKMKTLGKDLEDGTLSEKEAGIELNKTHINIDLNKTKSFLEDWSIKMQALIRELDNITKELDEKTDTK
ncbi:MAG TPA: hypothetical protein CFH81_07145 [Sulfurovum sp. UBA12169]|nr:MAG TPA: hypothetical protein CFH81_07145 [Sulfurovum sp. UBA12169]